MTRRRNPGLDLTFSSAHYEELPEVYRRTGHRLDVADRDWTEFCHFCRDPLAIYEEFRDVGQDLMDKGVQVSKKLAADAGIEAFAVAWRITRPADVQSEIDQLNRRVRALEALSSIAGFRVRRLAPQDSHRYVAVSTAEWWEQVRSIHGRHWHGCPGALRNGESLDVGRYILARGAHPLRVDAEPQLRVGQHEAGLWGLPL
jgi:hypothetical protein